MSKLFDDFNKIVSYKKQHKELQRKGGKCSISSGVAIHSFYYKLFNNILKIILGEFHS